MSAANKAIFLLAIGLVILALLLGLTAHHWPADWQIEYEDNLIETNPI